MSQIVDSVIERQLSLPEMNLLQLLQKKNALLNSIDELEAQVRPAIAPLKTELSDVEKLIEEMATMAAKKAMEDAKKDFGTVNLQLDEVAVKAVVDKKVAWDQAKLREIRGKILAAGDDASQYIDEKLTVAERKYTAWPDTIKKVFEPARTVTPGSIKFEFEEIPF